MELDIEYDFSIIAINSVANDVQIAYNLNKYLNACFNRVEDDLDVYFKDKAEPVYFPLYLHEDKQYMENWYLINNKFTSEEASVSTNKEELQDLFFASGISTQSNTYFLPEKKEINFILRLDSIEDENRLDQIIKKIRSIPIITTAYTIDYNTLRSKKNLIF